MKSKIIKGLFLGAIITLIFACNNENDKSAGAAIDKEKIKAEIQAKEDSFAAVYNSGQARSIGYFADDAESYFQNRPPLIGKSAIVSFLEQDIISSSDKISFKTREVFVSNDGNMVLEVGSFKLVDSVDVLINSGNYMSLFEKRNGKYVAVRDMSASDMPFRE